MENCNITLRCSTMEEYVGYVYIIPFICSLGVIFNILVLFVFSQSSFQARIGSSTLTYLTGLAVADGMASLVSLPIGYFRCVESENPVQKFFWNWYDKYIYFPFSNTFGTASVWITVAVSLERCIIVSRNNIQARHDVIFRTRFARVTLVIIFILSFAICFPIFYYYEDVSSESSTLIISCFGQSVNYEIYLWIRMFLVKFFPIIVVTACNFILIKTTWSSNRKISGLIILTGAVQARRTKIQYRMTYMLLSISTVFIVCNVAEPFAHTGVYKVMFGTCSIYSTEFNIFGMFTNMFEFIAFASNFVSYCIFHRHFVATLKMITCGKIRIYPITRERSLTIQTQNPYIVRSQCNEPGQDIGL